GRGEIEIKNRTVPAHGLDWRRIAAGDAGGRMLIQAVGQQARKGEPSMRPLEFGWYLPTHGDTTAYGLMEAQVAGSPELCDRVVQAAEAAGFEYLLIPVGPGGWEAGITGTV